MVRKNKIKYREIVKNQSLDKFLDDGTIDQEEDKGLDIGDMADD